MRAVFAPRPVGDRAIGRSGHRIIGTSGDRDIGRSGNREIGSSGHREAGSSGNRDIRSSGKRASSGHQNSLDRRGGTGCYRAMRAQCLISCRLCFTEMIFPEKSVRGMKIFIDSKEGFRLLYAMF